MHSINEGVARYTLRDRGRELVVEAWEADGRQHARLLVDGEAVGEKAVGVLEDAKFDLGEVDEEGKAVQQQVKAGFWWGGKVRECILQDVRAGDEELRKRTLKTPFVPPEGTRARRRYEMRERHPNLYAMRHVALEGLAIVVGFLGIGALLSAFFGRLLPSIDWSWLPDLPDLPDLDPPDWLRYLSPGYWIRRLWPDDWRLPDIDLSFLPDWDFGWLKYVIPLLIALGVGLQETERRRKRRERERRFERPGTRPEGEVRPEGGAPVADDVRTADDAPTTGDARSAGDALTADDAPTAGDARAEDGAQAEK
ncbi:hypothetical protein [Actinocorallia populi]|uniref:hypothetical protein n=1 Tax=Actinocorallia populi TaxID=2079200 RepID=UPI0013002392|nr:hypothetical protein [Actinocorallia populi]